MMATYHSDDHFATSSCWDQPRCPIESTKDEQLEANEQTLSMLQQITDSVVVVAVVGLYRTGKSYLMNRLAGRPARLRKKPEEGKPLETPRWRHFFSTFVIFNIMFLPVAICVLVEKPLNAAFMVGSDPVEFKCKSDQFFRLKWLTRQNQSNLILFDGFSISKEAESFCSVAPGEFYLKLTAIREAAQTYICQEPDTNEESSADLIIIEPEAQCKIDANNSHVIMKCDLEFRGNWAPELEWRYNGKLITEGVNASIISNKTVSSTLTVPVSANDRKYTCATRFDIRGKPQWTTSDNIPDYVSVSVLTVKTNRAIAESAGEMLAYPGHWMNIRCDQVKPGDRVIWSAEDKSGRKLVIYDGYMLNPIVSGYIIDNSSGVCSLAFIATKETAISYTCNKPGHIPENGHVTLSESAGEILAYPGQWMNFTCPQAKPGDRVIWSAEDKSGRKLVIYDGYMLNPNVSGYTIDNSSEVCSLAFVATKETAILYKCNKPGHIPEYGHVTLKVISEGSIIGLIMELATITVIEVIIVFIFLRKKAAEEEAAEVAELQTSMDQL